MPFNFEAGSWTAVVLYFVVVFSVFLFCLADVIIGEKKDKKEVNS